MTEQPRTIDKFRAKGWRNKFIEAFDQHEQLEENEEMVFEDEVIPEELDATPQKVIAAYDTVTVWLLNECGPLQAYYKEDVLYGEPGNVYAVAEEIAETLGDNQ